MPTSVFLAGAMYCTFPLYADSLGLGRPDNVVFAIGAVNLAWAILNGGKIFGCLAGFFAVSALAIHPQGIFLIVVMPIVVGILRGWRQWLEPRWAWWGLGACGGALLWIPQVDGDQLGRYMSLVKGAAVQLPPLLRWWRNPLEILQHAAHLLKPAFDLAGPAGLPFLGLLVATLIMRLRRLRTSGENQRTVTWLTTIYLAIS